MYFVKYGKEYLHDPRIEEYVLIDLSLDCDENTCGYCDFTIYPSHPMYNKLKERDVDNPIEVYDDDILLFSGFIYELGTEFYLDGHVKCKGELDYLSESIVRPYSTLENGYGDGQQPPTSVNGYFEWLITQHNNQVKDNKRFTIGINQGASLDPNNYIYRESTKYPNTWKEIGEKLLDELGGYLRIRHEDNTRYIDYLSEWTDTNSQILDFGKNLTDYTQTDDSESIATFVIPLGARMSDTAYSYNDGYYQTTDKTMNPDKEYYTKSDSGYTKCSDDLKAFESGVTYYEYFELFDESGLSLTIEGLEDKEYDTEGYRKSGDIIYCDSAVQKYGWIGVTYENTDITTKEQLVSKSIVALKELISPKRTIEIKAVDMHLVNPDIKPIRIGEYVRVRSKPHNLDSYFLCTSIDLDLNSPENSLYTLGTTFDTLTGQQNKRIKLLNATINQTYEQAEKLTEKEKQNALSADAARKESSEAKEAANNAKDVANEAKTAANNATTKAEEAKTNADSAISSAKDAADAAADAVKNADEAKANVTLVEGKLETIKSSADKAVQDASDAKTAADTAKSDASTAKDAAGKAQSAADSAQSKADEAYTAVGNVQSQVDNINKEVSEVKSDATALRDDLEGQIETVTNTMTADYAKKSELSSVESSLKTEISTSAGGVKTEVSQTYATKTELNSIKVGGRNLLLKSLSNDGDVTYDGTLTEDKFCGRPATYTGEWRGISMWKGADRCFARNNLRVGDIVTVSVYFMCESDTSSHNFYFYRGNSRDTETEGLYTDAPLNDSTQAGTIMVTPTLTGGVWYRLWCTFDITEYSLTNTDNMRFESNIGGVWWSSPKIEVGNKPTDWSPAPEDVDSSVSELSNNIETNYSTKSEVKQLSDQLSSTVSFVEEVKISAAAAQKTASDATTAAEAAQADATAAKNNADTAQSAADAAKEAANTAQSKADEAASNLATAEKNLSDLQQQANVTDEQLAAAKKDVENARTAADAAQSDADAAAKAASDAQKTADTAKDNAETAQATADAAKTAAEAAQADVDGLKNRVTKAETSIKQNTEQIALRATKDEVTEAANNAVEQSKTYADAQIKLSADNITSSVSKTYVTIEKVDNLQVGGRNLLRNTQKMDKISISSNVTISEDNEGYAVASFARTETLGWNCIRFTAPPVILSKILNKTITVSFEVKSSDYAEINAQEKNGLLLAIDTCGADTLDRERYNSFGLYSYELTDSWTKVTKTLNITESWFASGSGEITDNTRFIFKICDYSTYSMDVRKIKLEVGNMATDWTVAPEDVDDTIDGLNVVGKNLALFSDQEITNEEYNLANYDLSEDLVPGETYTVQIWGAVGDDKTGLGLWISRGYHGCGTVLTAGETYGALTFTCPEITKGGDYRYDRINIYALPQSVTASSSITKIKLEKGDKATEWSIAPEDLLSKNEAETIYTSQTDFSQTSEEFRMEFKKSVTSAVDDMQSKLDDSNEASSKKFNEIDKYIRFVDGKIVLGETGNELTLTVQNDRVSFQQSGNEVAYFSNNNLYIKRAEVLTTLRIGNYEWTPRNDGGLALRKRGI